MLQLLFSGVRAVLPFAALLAAAGAAGGPHENLAMSTRVVEVAADAAAAPLVRALAMKAAREIPGVRIKVRGLDGGDAPPPDLVLAFDPTENAGFAATPMAEIGIRVVINQRNPIDTISITQIRDIYAGRSFEWAEIGGPQVGFAVFAPPPEGALGTLFAEKIMRGDRPTLNIELVDDDAAMAQSIARYEGGIGLVDSRFKSDKVKFPALADGGEVLAERRLFMLRRQGAADVAAQFAEYFTTPQGRRAMRHFGLHPVDTE